MGWLGPGLESTVSSAPGSLVCTGPPALSVAASTAHQWRQGWASWTGQRGATTLPLNPGPHRGTLGHVSMHTEVETCVRACVCTCGCVPACSRG